jgi:hypothetical protein
MFISTTLITGAALVRYEWMNNMPIKREPNAYGAIIDNCWVEHIGLNKNIGGCLRLTGGQLKGKTPLSTKMPTIIILMVSLSES